MCVSSLINSNLFVIGYGENSNVKLLTMDKGVYRKDEWSQDDYELFYRFHDIFFFKITIVLSYKNDKNILSIKIPSWSLFEYHVGQTMENSCIVIKTLVKYKFPVSRFGQISLLLKEKYQYKLLLSFQSYLHLNATEVINLPTF